MTTNARDGVESVATTRNDELPFDHRETITTIEAANAATKAGMVLRIQPRAPATTEYCAIVNGRWAGRTRGRTRWTDSSVESVREAVEESLARGDSRPGVTVLDPERMDG